jgi:transposase InsO family protein
MYKTVGISKQAVHQYINRQQIFDAKLLQLVIEAEELRADHPGCGVEKMYEVLKPGFIGRDRFVEVMMQLGFRLKRKKNYKRTTIAGRLFYPNLIKGLPVNRPSQVWQSDITYIPVDGCHYYGVFIIDVYTKKIVGYQVSDHMRAMANLQALKMALKHHKPPDIHHSDRGSQFTYTAYIDLLKQNNCKISMALCGQDNAYAERINRTIKEEYLDYWKPKNYQQLKGYLKKAVTNYNTLRPHNHLNKMSPETFEQYWSSLSTERRPEITIFNNEINV